MSSNQTVLLVLKCSDLTSGQTTAVGYMSTRKTYMTWNNINMRVLLGDMWEKFDNFNISLAQIACDGGGVSGLITTTSLMLNVWLSGLPLVNGFYDTSTKLKSNTALIGCFRNDQYVVNSFNGLNTLTFNKNQEQANISIYYTSVSGQTNAQLEALGGNYTGPTFTFQIRGCKISNNNVSEDKRISIK